MDRPDAPVNPPYPPFGFEAVASAQEMTGIAPLPVAPADPFDGAAWEDMEAADEELFE